MELKYNAKKEEEIEKFLVNNGYSKKIIREIKNSIYVNGIPKRKWEKITCNDLLMVVFPDEKSTIVPVLKDFDIVYEDEYILVVNKETGIPVMPNRGYYENSLANYIMGYYQDKKISTTIHLVNRLDKDTSGLVLIAKNSFIHSLLSKQNIVKKYYAVAKGKILEDGAINLPIIKGEGIKRIIGGNKEALTIYKVLEIRENTLVDVVLKSGRTHQIRVHFASLGHPLIGDSLYGMKGILALQSYYLSFFHPITKKNMIFELPIDKKMTNNL